MRAREAICALLLVLPIPSYAGFYAWVMPQDQDLRWWIAPTEERAFDAMQHHSTYAFAPSSPPVTRCEKPGWYGVVHLYVGRVPSFGGACGQANREAALRAAIKSCTGKPNCGPILEQRGYSQLDIDSGFDDGKQDIPNPPGPSTEYYSPRGKDHVACQDFPPEPGSSGSRPAVCGKAMAPDPSDPATTPFNIGVFLRKYAR
ncbi:hypothetical protein R70199_06981 [Paraburkholderia domus]|nr:hypothetical protein R70199_06981 [Paraburkholderia domus]